MSSQKHCSSSPIKKYFGTNRKSIILIIQALNFSEWRYVLAGSSDGLIAIYDTNQEKVSKNESPKSIAEVVGITSNLTSTNKASTSVVQWHPFDNGLFVSSGTDGKLKGICTRNQIENVFFKLTSCSGFKYLPCQARFEFGSDLFQKSGLVSSVINEILVRSSF